MKWTRYEILLPQRYNDGRPVERRKFRQTNLELVEKFSAVTTDITTAIGSWRYRGTVYEDVLVRLIVDVPGSHPADDFFRGSTKRL